MNLRKKGTKNESNQMRSGVCVIHYVVVCFTNYSHLYEEHTAKKKTKRIDDEKKKKH